MKSRGTLKTQIVTATVTKQRDGEIGQAFALRLDPVDIGEDQDGDRITSCVVMPEDAAEAGLSERQAKTATQVANVPEDLFEEAGLLLL